MKKVRNITLHRELPQDTSEETAGLTRIEEVKVLYEDGTEEILSSLSFEFQYFDNDESYQQMIQEVSQRFSVFPTQIKVI